MGGKKGKGRGEGTGEVALWALEGMDNLDHWAWVIYPKASIFNAIL